MEIKNYINEEWRPINGYEGLYEVSNYGRIKNTKRNRIRKQQFRRGYKCICLRKKGKKKYFSVHRLVALAFLPNPNNYPEVNHIDEDKSNNCVWNLDWCNRKHNANWGTAIERTINKRIKKVLCIDNNTIYNSLKEAAIDLKVNRGGISLVCQGKRKACCGYRFKYINNDKSIN